MKKILAFLFLLPSLLQSQDIVYARYILDSLASPAFHGRGYTFSADSFAADFLASELKKARIIPYGDTYFQEFTLNTNVFPDAMNVNINGYELKPGADYIINAKSNSIDGDFKIYTIDYQLVTSEKKFIKFKQKDFSNTFIFIDTNGFNLPDFKAEYENITHNNSLKARGIITVSDKLTYIPARSQNNYVHIIIKKDAVPKKISKISVKIDAVYKQNYKTRNVIGYIKGEVDSFIVITAHLDHLGTMGKNTFFPGAHDNASGCAMVMNLAKYYGNLRCIPHYNLVFIFFSGEELGLLGSKYFTENPLFPLDKIKFLLNVDMMGSGDEGIRVVNSTIFTKEYQMMLDINKKENLLPQIKKRGAAANSDHYFFYANGVPCFFAYSLGKYKEYHNIYDSRENIPLAGYEPMFKLFEKFIEKLNGK